MLKIIYTRKENEIYVKVNNTMNSNRLTLKDFIVIYLLIFSIVIFLAGFFLGAKVMEKQLLETKKNQITNLKDTQ